jgi:aminoacylase
MNQLQAIDTAMVEFLQQYIQIDTTHPDADYKKAVNLFTQQAQKDGFTHQEVILTSGFPVLIITYEGTDSSLPSFVLNHHMDVVPVPNAQEWIKPPFEGCVHEGTIIGRGTQDMKGVGVVHYFALKALKDAGIRPERTIHLFLVPDEERGGFGGTQLFLETDVFKKLNVGYVVDEGCASDNPSCLYIKVDERKPLQVRLTARGELAHGSRLTAHNAAHDLVQALQHIVSHHEAQKAQLVETAAGLLLSMNITSLHAGAYNDSHVALNVVADSATATIDIRIPPTIQIQQIHDWLTIHLTSFPSITLHVEATVDERLQRTEYKTVLYKELSQAIATQGLDVQPLFTEGASDLRFYLAHNIDGIGFSPFTNKDNIHGTDEAILIVDMVRGKRIILSLLNYMCVKVGKPC